MKWLWHVESTGVYSLQKILTSDKGAEFTIYYFYYNTSFNCCTTGSTGRRATVLSETLSGELAGTAAFCLDPSELELVVYAIGG